MSDNPEFAKEVQACYMISKLTGSPWWLQKIAIENIGTERYLCIYTNKLVGHTELSGVPEVINGIKTKIKFKKQKYYSSKSIPPYIRQAR